MQSILQSHFLQSLAYALIKSIWQLGLLWLVVIFLFAIFKLSSSQKFVVAFIAQITGFILFLFAIIKGVSVSYITSPSPEFYLEKAAVFFQIIMPLIAAFYILILCWQIVKFIFNYRFAQNLRNTNLTKMPAMSRVFVDELTAAFSLNKKVKIYLSKNIRCPLTIGFLKPVILIPLAAVNYLSKEQMEAVIVHELAHIKRADYLINLLQCCIDKILFFNIFSRLFTNIIERERENACDDWVLQFKYNSFHYAEALIKLGKLQTSYSLAMAVAGKKENVLLSRIKRLIYASEKKSFYTHGSLQFSFFSLIIAASLLCSFSLNTKNAIAVHKIKKDNVLSVIKPGELQTSLLVTANNAAKTLSLKKNTQEIAVIKNKEIKKVEKKVSTVAKVETARSFYNAPVYLTQVNAITDSGKSNYSVAVNSKILLDTSAYKKVMSYQNFKRLETMLALTGDSINVYEDPSSEDNYKKLITIETTDKQGNKNLYQVEVELYQ